MPLGTHIIADLHDIVNIKLLKTKDFIERIATESCLKNGAEVLTSHFHSFGHDSGFTGVIVLSESHLSIHTWPEYKYASLDIFTCGNKAKPDLIVNDIIAILDSRRFEIKIVKRGEING